MGGSSLFSPVQVSKGNMSLSLGAEPGLWETQGQVLFGPVPGSCDSLHRELPTVCVWQEVGGGCFRATVFLSFPKFMKTTQKWAVYAELAQVKS